jgi:hypothetical protein
MKFNSFGRAVLFGILYFGLFTLNRLLFPANFQYLQHLTSLSFTFVVALLYLYRKKALVVEYLTFSITLLVCFNVLTTLSMNIDRSRSVEVVVLVQLAEKKGVSFQRMLKENAISKSELDSYIQRFSEQSQVKLISGDAKKPKLTLLGRIFLGIADYLARIWDLDGFGRIGNPD